MALAQCAASARHFMGLTSEQSLYNLAVRTVELELIPALRSLGIGLIPYRPAPRRPARRRAPEPPPRKASPTTRCSSASRRTAISSKPTRGCAGSLAAKPVDVALAWLLRNPVVSTTIVGATTIEELRSDLGALTVQSDAEGGPPRPDLAGAGGKPPAYAWKGRPRHLPRALARLTRQQAATREPFWQARRHDRPPYLPAHWRPWRAVRHAT